MKRGRFFILNANLVTLKDLTYEGNPYQNFALQWDYEIRIHALNFACLKLYIDTVEENISSMRGGFKPFNVLYISIVRYYRLLF